MATAQCATTADSMIDTVDLDSLDDSTTLSARNRRQRRDPEGEPPAGDGHARGQNADRFEMEQRLAHAACNDHPADPDTPAAGDESRDLKLPRERGAVPDFISVAIRAEWLTMNTATDAQASIGVPVARPRRPGANRCEPDDSRTIVMRRAYARRPS